MANPQNATVMTWLMAKLTVPVQYRMGDYEEAVVAYLRAADIGMEIGQSNAAWMLSRGHGAQGPAAAALAMKLHQRAAGQVMLPAVITISLAGGAWQLTAVGDVQHLVPCQTLCHLLAPPFPQPATHAAQILNGFMHTSRWVHTRRTVG